MRFEKFLLDNYIATEEGRRVLHIFKNLYSYIDAGDTDNTVLDFINSLLYKPIAKDFFVFEPLKEPIETGELQYPSFSEFEAWIYQYFDNIKNEGNCSCRAVLQKIPRLSVLDFFRFAPEYAFPYLYPVHFNVLQSIFEEFGIPLPTLPGPRQYEDRIKYYVELCKVLYEFRTMHNLSPEELCVFLYGFAKKFVSHNILVDLPQPNTIWIVGATSQDTIDFLSNIDSNTVQWWAGNEKMQYGDMVLIYEVAPRSAFATLWRTISHGYDDPFQYYAGKVWLAHPITIPEITFQDLKTDPYFSKHGLVRAHMQGIAGGRAFTTEDYREVLLLLQSKGFDISILPELLSHNLNIDVEILNERDVEEHLLEPFLAKLGIQKKHITRQMPLRMGRGVRYYPDYVINAKSDRGEERGAFVWEAKYRITSQKQMLEDFYQAKSYALRLNTNGLGLVSYEGLWLSLKSDAWDIKKIQHVKWLDLKNPDTFGRISTVLKKAFGNLICL